MNKLVKLTHFCEKCGWIDDIEVAARLVEGSKNSFIPLETDITPKCPKCGLRHVYALNMKNAPKALAYLLRALR